MKTLRRTLRYALGGAALATFVFVATVGAAGPTPSPSGPAGRQASDADTIPAVLGLTQAEITRLRHDGLSLAQIADRQKVDPQKLIDALVAQWSERIDVRVTNGALTAAEAATLKEQLPVKAKAMVYQVTLGGMQGAAVGAGPGSGAGQGTGTGTRMGPGPKAGSGAAAGTGTTTRTGTATNAGTRRGMHRGTGTGTCDGTGPHGPQSR